MILPSLLAPASLTSTQKSQSYRTLALKFSNQRNSKPSPPSTRSALQTYANGQVKVNGGNRVEISDSGGRSYFNHRSGCYHLFCRLSRSLELLIDLKRDLSSTHYQHYLPLCPTRAEQSYESRCRPLDSNNRNFRTSGSSPPACLKSNSSRYRLWCRTRGAIDARPRRCCASTVLQTQEVKSLALSRGVTASTTRKFQSVSRAHKQGRPIEIVYGGRC